MFQLIIAIVAFHFVIATVMFKLATTKETRARARAFLAAPYVFLYKKLASSNTVKTTTHEAAVILEKAWFLHENMNVTINHPCLANVEHDVEQFFLQAQTETMIEFFTGFSEELLEELLKVTPESDTSERRSSRAEVMAIRVLES